MTKRGVLRQLPGWKWTFNVDPSIVQRRKLTACSAIWFFANLMINEYNFHTWFFKISAAENWRRFMKLIWFSFSIMFYLEDCCIHIVPLTYTLKRQGLQLFKCSLDNRFCNCLFHYWNYRRHFIGHLNDIQSLKTSSLMHDQRARRCEIKMHWNDGLVDARHPDMHCVFATQHTCATDFFLEMWYDFIEKCFFFWNTWCQILPHALKNPHDHIYTFPQIKG